MHIAFVGKGLPWKGIVNRLGFLKANNIWRGFLRQPFNQPHTEPDRIDVPGGDFHDLTQATRAAGAATGVTEPRPAG